jgi:hypothetical protein
VSPRDLISVLPAPPRAMPALVAPPVFIARASHSGGSNSGRSLYQRRYEAYAPGRGQPPHSDFPVPTAARNLQPHQWHTSLIAAKTRSLPTPEARVLGFPVSSAAIVSISVSFTASAGNLCGLVSPPQSLSKAIIESRVDEREE